MIDPTQPDNKAKSKVKQVDKENYEHLTSESTSLEWDATHEARKDVMEQERRRRLEREQQDQNSQS